MEKELIIARHFDFFQDFGFLFHNSHGLFYKNFPLGKQAIFIHYTEYGEEAYLEYNLGVRLDHVEELIHQYLPTLKDYADRSLTLIQSAHSIDQSLPNRFLLDQSLPLSEAQLIAEGFFVKNGFAWLDRMIDPKNLQKEFYAKKTDGFKSQNYAYHVFRATALAKLYAPDHYQELRTFFLSHLEHRGITPFTIASYLQFLNQLDKMDL